MAIPEDQKQQQPTHQVDGIVENRVTAPPVYFSVLYYGLILWGVIFGAFYLLSGWSSEAEFHQQLAAHQQLVKGQGGSQPSGGATATATQSIPDEATRIATGQKLFSENCAACHGAEAKGGIGPDLTRSQFNFGRTREAITTSISGGRPGGMPAFGNQFSGEQLAGLASFVLSLK